MPTSSTDPLLPEALARAASARCAPSDPPDRAARRIADALIERVGSHPPDSLADALSYGHGYALARRGLHPVEAARAGIVYTPADVARRLVRLGREAAPAAREAVDPACGCGALLLAWLEAVPGGAVTGFDVDPHALRLAEVLLEAFSTERRETRRVRLERADLFDIDWPAREGAEAGGQLVLMNPPFGTRLSKGARAFAGHAGWAGREPDSFALALERMAGLQPSRPVAAVVSDVVRMQTDYTPLRHSLTASGRLRSVVQLPFGAFEGVTVQPALVTLDRQSHEEPVTIELVGEAPTAVAAADLLDDADCRWRPAQTRLRALWSLCRSEAVALGDVAACHEGVHTGNVRHKLFTDDPDSPHARPMYKGADVQPFSLTFRGRYLRYDSGRIERSLGEYASLRDPAIFLGPKLLSRQTTSRLTVALDPTDAVADNSLHTIRLRPGRDRCEGLSLAWLALVLNSELMRALYRFESGEGRRPLPQVKLRILRRLPVRRPAARPREIESLCRQARSEAARGGLRRETLARVNGIVFDTYHVPELDREWLLNDLLESTGLERR